MADTDRELLELAAKAAGMKFKGSKTNPDGYQTQQDDPPYGPRPWVPWNPLTDDGDRYRLARACNLVIDFDAGEVRWRVDGRVYPGSFRWMPGGSVGLEARAIVRAAAEIGRDA